MQQNFSHKNKSQLIKTSIDAKKKAKRRLIGSITMLLIALVFLLSVTSRVKPIPITPQIIKFNNTNSKNNATNMQKATNKPITNDDTGAIHDNKPIRIQVNNIHSSQAISDTFAPSDTKKIGDKVEPEEYKVFIKPRIVSKTITPKLSPEDILNGKNSLKSNAVYYIIIANSSSKEALQDLQQNFLEQHIKTIVQEIQTPNGIVFRLRSDSFNTKDDAVSSLSKIHNVIKRYQ